MSLTRTELTKVPEEVNGEATDLSLEDMRSHDPRNIWQRSDLEYSSFVAN